MHSAQKNDFCDSHKDDSMLPERSELSNKYFQKGMVSPRSTQSTHCEFCVNFLLVFFSSEFKIKYISKKLYIQGMCVCVWASRQRFVLYGTSMRFWHLPGAIFYNLKAPHSVIWPVFQASCLQYPLHIYISRGVGCVLKLGCGKLPNRILDLHITRFSTLYNPPHHKSCAQRFLLSLFFWAKTAFGRV